MDPETPQRVAETLQGATLQGVGTADDFKGMREHGPVLPTEHKRHRIRRIVHIQGVNLQGVDLQGAGATDDPQGVGVGGEDIVTKELQPLNDREVREPKRPNELTKDQRARVPSYLMFLNMKRNGTIRGRGCADGRKQSDWQSKDDTIFPTISNEELYEQYLVKGKNEKPMMFAEAKKALCGTVDVSLLFWLKLTGSGSEMNQYDWRCMKNMINSKQCTILWHADGIKISHEDSSAVTFSEKKKEDERKDLPPMAVAFKECVE